MPPKKRVPPATTATTTAPANPDAGYTAALDLIRADLVTGWTVGPSTLHCPLTSTIGYDGVRYRVHVSVNRTDLRRVIGDRWEDGYSAEEILLDAMANIGFHITIEAVAAQSSDNPRFDSAGWNYPATGNGHDVGEALYYATNDPATAGTDTTTRGLQGDWRAVQAEVNDTFHDLRVNQS